MIENDFQGYPPSYQASHFYRDKVGVIVLCGGEGKRLSPLTYWRCKPTVSFGGRYKLIDVPISHAIASGFSKIFVIGQYLTYTLQQHLVKTYFYHGVLQDQIHFLAPEGRDGSQIWYQGTADAIRQNLLYLEDTGIEYFLVLSGDQLYNMDFRRVVDYALSMQSDMVIVAQPIQEKDALRMGVLQIDKDANLLDFYEKPQDEEVLNRFRLSSEDCRKHKLDPQYGNFLGNMGIYLFRRESLFQLLLEEQGDDFGKHLIQAQMKRGSVKTFLYDGYWTDIGTIESYYEANIALTQKPKPQVRGLNCYDDRGMIYSKNHHLPGTIVTDSMISNSLLCEGAVIDSSNVSHSVVGIRGVIGKNSVIDHSIVMGNDRYGSLNHNTLGIGDNCEIYKTIIDENCRIGNGVKLTNMQGHRDYDSPDGKLVVRDGIIIIPRGTRIPDNYTF
ncbi:Glucose-1-phosphate adenylyltransferase,glucose-1-phosphate adenylyltransferase,glucose-1-phosphate adenylyltransferase,Nucleotidyl transferase [Chlamydia poikilotherma]|uniref:Glucose-1-phosphate adenylyltransferase n=1 Tax=Chlamydia poikilotherma TaxID=1967783 RepID=A0A3B0QF37_9CHLA|nr:glucose-1-phosphate adenylyltransferase [Chlamydia poikilotherma]SYX08624.1 Glucose-1-phosphate adenylyltransferase,glucose-1-phosphate adenylyltransferase,glucose-1-phosphate adenylyltransferase,Nucleotidyl transferase [Chlamydia poikilotherma]